jgi:hypothetical protein
MQASQSSVVSIFALFIHVDFNQSHISYQGDGEFSSRPNHHAPLHHHGGVSQIEAEEMAKEEYERVLDDLRHQEGVTSNDIRNFEKTAIIKKSLNIVKDYAQF